MRSQKDFTLKELVTSLTPAELVILVITLAVIAMLLILFFQKTDDIQTLEDKNISQAALEHAEATADQPTAEIDAPVYWPETLNGTLKENLRKAEEAFEEARVVWQREETPEAKRKMNEAREVVYRIIRTIPSEAAMESLIKEAIEKAEIALDQAQADYAAGETSEAEVKKAEETLFMLYSALPTEIKHELIIEEVPAYLGEPTKNDPNN